jgi:hypothetical protein
VIVQVIGLQQADRRFGACVGAEQRECAHPQKTHDRDRGAPHPQLSPAHEQEQGGDQQNRNAQQRGQRIPR